VISRLSTKKTACPTDPSTDSCSPCFARGEGVAGHWAVGREVLSLSLSLAPPWLVLWLIDHVMFSFGLGYHEGLKSRRRGAVEHEEQKDSPWRRDETGPDNRSSHGRFVPHASPRLRLPRPRPRPQGDRRRTTVTGPPRGKGREVTTCGKKEKGGPFFPFPSLGSLGHQLIQPPSLMRPVQ